MSGAQQRGYEALGAILRYGAVNRLPELAWKVAADGTLAGEPTRGDERAAVDLWAVHLDTGVQQTAGPDGTTRLQADFTWDRDLTAIAHGTIRADIPGGAA